MISHPLRAARVNLIVPGIDGSGPAHWQSLWEESRSDCQRVDLGDWHHPTPSRWMAHLEEAVQRHRGSRITLVAHSLGCILVAWWTHYHMHTASRLAGALLVAPCNPAGSRDRRLGLFSPVPLNRLPFPVTVVASRNDPYASFDWSVRFARSIGARLIDAGPVGHINAECGLGSWTQGQKLLEDLIQRRGPAGGKDDSRSRATPHGAVPALRAFPSEYPER